MGKVFIVCPECRQQLSFMAVPGYQNMLVECPKCHFKAAASVYLSGLSARGAQGAPEVATQLIDAPVSGAAAHPGRLRVKGVPQAFALKPGGNVVGRQAQTGTADIQIPGDMYMSRRHVEIRVVPAAGGWAHHLVEINSKNVVKLNGKDIKRGDIIVLHFGDVLTLGTTEAVLEAADTEETYLV